MPSISQTPSIYQIRHIASGRVYVGSAVNPRQRWAHHRAVLKSKSHHSQHLQNAWDKYGADAFAFEIIEPVLFIEDLIAREQYWIDALRAGDRAHGYNTSKIAGSTLGVQKSDAERAKIGAASKARWEDPAYRANMKKRRAEHHADPAVRARIAEKTKEQFSDPDKRETAAAGQRARYTRQEERDRSSKQGKLNHADPTLRARLLEGLAAWRLKRKKSKL